MSHATTSSTFWAVSATGVESVAPSEERISGLRTDDLEMTVFSVGEGETILLTRRRLAMLVDGGSGMQHTNQQLGDALRNYILAKHLKLRAVVASHPHVDHTNAEAVVLTLATPDILARKVAHFDNGTRRDKQIVQSILGAINTLTDRAATTAVPDNSPQAFRLSNDVKTRLFATGRDGRGDDYKSVFMFVRFREARLLLTGDAYKRYEQKLLAVGVLKPLMTAHVLKITHHGSDGGTGAGFVKNCRPKIAVASTAEAADHRLEASVKQRLGSRCRTFDTHSVGGDITIRTDGRPVVAGGSDVLYEVEIVRPGRLMPHA